MHVPVPIGGPLAVPLRLFGITRSKMNPNICTICERAFRSVKRRSQITTSATILFADIRGYTRLSEQIDPAVLGGIVGRFQDRCAQAIWRHDGIVNKQMGDGMMAIFNFPITRGDHAAAAVRAAQEIQRTSAEQLAASGAQDIGVGVGIHTGDVAIGEFSSFRTDFTAIGGSVNLAARLEAQADTGEIVVSADVAAAVPEVFAGAEERRLQLKGIEGDVSARVLRADTAR